MKNKGKGTLPNKSLYNRRQQRKRTYVGKEHGGGQYDRRLSPVSVALSDEEYCYSFLDGMLVYRRLLPSSISPINASVWTEALWE